MPDLAMIGLVPLSFGIPVAITTITRSLGRAIGIPGRSPRYVGCMRTTALPRIAPHEKTQLGLITMDIRHDRDPEFDLFTQNMGKVVLEVGVMGTRKGTSVEIKRVARACPCLSLEGDTTTLVASGKVRSPAR